jgi:hypothetical protein
MNTNLSSIVDDVALDEVAYVLPPWGFIMNNVAARTNTKAAFFCERVSTAEPLRETMFGSGESAVHSQQPNESHIVYATETISPGQTLSVDLIDDYLLHTGDLVHTGDLPTSSLEYTPDSATNYLGTNFFFNNQIKPGLQSLAVDAALYSGTNNVCVSGMILKIKRLKVRLHLCVRQTVELTPVGSLFISGERRESGTDPEAAAFFFYLDNTGVKMIHEDEVLANVFTDSMLASARDFVRPTDETAASHCVMVKVGNRYSVFRLPDTVNASKSPFDLDNVNMFNCRKLKPEMRLYPGQSSAGGDIIDSVTLDLNIMRQLSATDNHCVRQNMASMAASVAAITGRFEKCGPDRYGFDTPPLGADLVLNIGPSTDDTTDRWVNVTNQNGRIEQLYIDNRDRVEVATPPFSNRLESFCENGSNDALRSTFQRESMCSRVVKSITISGINDVCKLVARPLGDSPPIDLDDYDIIGGGKVRIAGLNPKDMNGDYKKMGAHLFVKRIGQKSGTSFVLVRYDNRDHLAIFHNDTIKYTKLKARLKIELEKTTPNNRKIHDLQRQLQQLSDVNAEKGGRTQEIDVEVVLEAVADNRLDLRSNKASAHVVGEGDPDAELIEFVNCGGITGLKHINYKGSCASHYDRCLPADIMQRAFDLASKPYWIGGKRFIKGRNSDLDVEPPANASVQVPTAQAIVVQPNQPALPPPNQPAQPPPNQPAQPPAVDPNYVDRFTAWLRDPSNLHMSPVFCAVIHEVLDNQKYLRERATCLQLFGFEWIEIVSSYRDYNYIQRMAPNYRYTSTAPAPAQFSAAPHDGYFSKDDQISLLTDPQQTFDQLNLMLDLFRIGNDSPSSPDVDALREMVDSPVGSPTDFDALPEMVVGSPTDFDALGEMVGSPVGSPTDWGAIRYVVGDETPAATLPASPLPAPTQKKPDSLFRALQELGTLPDLPNFPDLGSVPSNDSLDKVAASVVADAELFDRLNLDHSVKVTDLLEYPKCSTVLMNKLKKYIRFLYGWAKKCRACGGVTFKHHAPKGKTQILFHNSGVKIIRGGTSISVDSCNSAEEMGRLALIMRAAFLRPHCNLNGKVSSDNFELFLKHFGAVTFFYSELADEVYEPVYQTSSLASAFDPHFQPIHEDGLVLQIQAEMKTPGPVIAKVNQYLQRNRLSMVVARQRQIGERVILVTRHPPVPTKRKRLIDAPTESDKLFGVLNYRIAAVDAEFDDYGFKCGDYYLALNSDNSGAASLGWFRRAEQFLACEKEFNVKLDKKNLRLLTDYARTAMLSKTPCGREGFTALKTPRSLFLHLCDPIRLPPISTHPTRKITTALSFIGAGTPLACVHYEKVDTAAAVRQYRADFSTSLFKNAFREGVHLKPYLFGPFREFQSVRQAFEKCDSAEQATYGMDPFTGVWHAHASTAFQWACSLCLSNVDSSNFANFVSDRESTFPFVHDDQHQIIYRAFPPQDEWMDLEKCGYVFAMVLLVGAPMVTDDAARLVRLTREFIQGGLRRLRNRLSPRQQNVSRADHYTASAEDVIDNDDDKRFLTQLFGNLEFPLFPPPGNKVLRLIDQKTMESMNDRFMVVVGDHPNKRVCKNCMINQMVPGSYSQIKIGNKLQPANGIFDQNVNSIFARLLPELPDPVQQFIKTHCGMTQTTFPFVKPSPFLRTMILDTDPQNFGNFKWKSADQIQNLLVALNEDHRRMILDSWPPPEPQTSSCKSGPVPIQYHKPHAQFCPNSFPRHEFLRARNFVKKRLYLPLRPDEMPSVRPFPLQPAPANSGPPQPPPGPSPSPPNLGPPPPQPSRPVQRSRQFNQRPPIRYIQFNDDPRPNDPRPNDPRRSRSVRPPELRQLQRI